jgi:hypothetical protein
MLVIGKEAAKKSSTNKHKIATGAGVKKKAAGRGGSAATILNTAAAYKLRYGKDMESHMIGPYTSIAGGSPIAHALTKLKSDKVVEVTKELIIVTDKCMEEGLY